MKCPRCHSENNDASHFCGNCAAPLSGGTGPDVTFTRTMVTPAPAASPGSLIAGKYKVVEEIGRGGMGVVYKAEDIKLKRFVALKFLPFHLADEAELRERFLIEAQAAAALNHPNICVIHEVAETEGRPYIAMEFVEGETLRDKIKKSPLSPADSIAIISQVSAGLAAAHAKGIVHRDIKTANIMVTDGGQAKVMDFGLAKLRGGSSLTRTQTTLGTVAYMSPEQARGAKVDERTDIWSLGIVLFEMLTGRLPFHGDHDQAMIHSILHAQPEPLSKARPDAPAGLGAIIGQALAKKPDERYRKTEDLLADLKAVADGLKPKARPRSAGRTILGIRSGYVCAGLAVIVAIAFGTNAGGLRDRLLGKTGTSARAIRLAVLPFANLSGDPEQEYLSDGLTQEMIAQLGRLHPDSLSVIARTSVMRYKKTNTPIDQVGRELNVEYVLEGSVQREGPRVRIRAELIEVEGQSQLWADSLEREMSGVLVLQNEVSRKVAGALALKLLPAEQARLADVHPVDPRAYELYLRASQFWPTLTKANLDTAENYLNLALEIDPDYADAYAGIASVWACRQQMDLALPQEAGPKAKAAALKAIQLDGNNAAAHRALAGRLTWSDWDWTAAEREFKHAIELEPGGTDALPAYSHFLMMMGRTEEGLALGQRAIALDPFNITAQSFYAVNLLCARRYEEAIAQARKALNMQPGHSVAHTALYGAFVVRERYEDALAIDKADYADDPESLDAFNRGFAEAGYLGSQKRWAELMEKRYQEGKAPAEAAAFGYVWAKEKDLALNWLEKAVEEHNPSMPYLGCFPMYDFLRSEPRFQALLRRMGIPVRESR